MRERYEDFIHDDDEEVVTYWVYKDNIQELQAVRIGTFDGSTYRTDVVGRITLEQIKTELGKHVTHYQDKAWWDKNNFEQALMKLVKPKR